MVKVGNFSEYQWSKIKNIFKGVGDDHELYRLPSGMYELWVHEPSALLYNALNRLFILQSNLDSIKEVEMICNGK